MTTNDQVAKREEQADTVAGFVPQSPYMSGLHGDDFTPPTFQLLQPTSKAVSDGAGRPGQLYSPAIGIAKDQLNCVVLHIQKTRTLWSEDLGQPPQCSSNDGETPNAGGIVEVPCAQCPYVDKECIGGYMYLCYDLDDDYPFVIRCSTRTSLAAAKSFNTAAAMMLKGSPFLARTTIGAQARENTKGHFFVLNIRLGERFAPDAAQRWQDLAQKMATDRGWAQSPDAGAGTEDAKNTPPATVPQAPAQAAQPTPEPPQTEQPTAPQAPAAEAASPQPVDDDDLAF